MMQSVLRAASTIISLYMMLIFVRVLLSWFSGVSYGRAAQLLAQITDPYLNWFRRHMRLVIGGLDFSVVVAVMALGLLNTVLVQLAVAGRITLGFLLAIILSATWSIVSFFAGFFLILGVIRLVGMLARIDHRGRFWLVIEQLLNPFLQMVVRPFLRGRFTGYRESLVIFIGVLGALLVVGNLGISFLVAAVRALPV